MADIPASKSPIDTDDVAANKPVSEALNIKYGANINGLIITSDNNAANIATNTADISQLETTVDDLIKPRGINSPGNTVTTSISTVASFSQSPRSAFFQVDVASPSVEVTVTITSSKSMTIAVGGDTITFSISGDNIRAVSSSGSFTVGVFGEAFF